GVIAAELEQGDLIAAQSEQRVLDAELAKLPPDAMSGMPKLIAASIAREAGDSATARKLGEEARAELRKAEANRETVQCEVLLARVAIDDGRAADGASLASQAADEAHPLGLRNDEARALAVLATARLAAGDRDAAQAALDRATLL